MKGLIFVKRRCLKCSNKVYGNQIFCCERCRYKYYHNNDMVLTLKKQWFDMILQGVKTEEYREIKPYWEIRFYNYFGQHYDFSKGKPRIVWNKQQKDIVFRNGYGKNKPEFTAECTISEGYGKSEWGAVPNKKYYILTIHRIFDIKNLN